MQDNTEEERGSNSETSVKAFPPPSLLLTAPAGAHTVSYGRAKSSPRCCLFRIKHTALTMGCVVTGQSPVKALEPSPNLPHGLPLHHLPPSLREGCSIRKSWAVFT